jgi:pimeloyl-ACP methyl ester carboxylesterase
MAAVHTIARELDAIAAAPLDPARAAAIAAPTLLLVGGDSSDPSASEVGSVAAALPDARIEVLEGQTHVADVLAPELFARSLLEFLRA